MLDLKKRGGSALEEALHVWWSGEKIWDSDIDFERDDNASLEDHPRPGSRPSLFSRTTSPSSYVTEVKTYCFQAP
jgi:hypothetical protein